MNESDRFRLLMEAARTLGPALVPVPPPTRLQRLWLSIRHGYAFKGC